jgi:hypothetical protein
VKKSRNSPPVWSAVTAVQAGGAAAIFHIRSGFELENSDGYVLFFGSPRS